RNTQGKFSAKKTDKQSASRSTKPILIAAVVLLALAVLVVFYFIGDMIGWWPGLEDTIDRSNTEMESDQLCSELTIDPTELILETPGDEAQFTVSTNLECGEIVYCSSGDESIVTVSENAKTAENEEFKSVTFTVTAQAEGQTVISVTCGDKKVTCQVTCGDGQSETQAQTAPEDYVPMLNQEGEIAFSSEGMTVTLQVTNLPEGLNVLWTSADPSIATVDSSGKVTAVSGGKTTITADVGGKTAEIVIRCNFGDFIDQGAHLEAGKEDVSLRVGESFPLFLYDSQSQHITEITYTVADPSICTVEDGYVTAVGYGTTTITITYYSLTFECIVRVY
ncbi:MAG: Ig-like domain-containing protein, partial [Oscillospiraceae bacterium]|nr:Ig-like domain-containing protein [Oscillospiraceae bacterium]